MSDGTACLSAEAMLPSAAKRARTEHELSVISAPSAAPAAGQSFVLTRGMVRRTPGIEWGSLGKVRRYSATCASAASGISYYDEERQMLLRMAPDTMIEGTLVDVCRRGPMDR
jgi:hypothetical protein